MASKSKAELMKRLYQRRKAAGLVQFKVWVTPEQKEKLKAELERLKGYCTDDLSNFGAGF